MNLLEILKANGIDDEIATKITNDMKANKVFTASEENLDIRYAKLKMTTQHQHRQLQIYSHRLHSLSS